MPLRPLLTATQIRRADYVGSGEHKVARWWGDKPLARVGRDGVARRPGKQLTTICRRTQEADRIEASRWVRAALRKGQFEFQEGDKTFPKHIWYRDDTGQFWFGFSVNQTAGSYKGWPISEDDKVAIFGRVA